MGSASHNTVDTIGTRLVPIRRRSWNWADQPPLFTGNASVKERPLELRDLVGQSFVLMRKPHVLFLQAEITGGGGLAKQVLSLRPVAIGARIFEGHE
jgi:hypothetical protein